MRKLISYLLYFGGFFASLILLSDVVVTTDKGEDVFRPIEYAAIVIAVSLSVYFVFRDAATIVRGKKFTEE